MQEENRVRRSTVPVRLILKDFCVEFLDNSYNSIMHTVKVKGVQLINVN